MEISLIAAAIANSPIGIPRKRKRTQMGHWSWVKGVVLAKSPRNWTRMNWTMYCAGEHAHENGVL
jgi:hypothetical protein